MAALPRAWLRGRGLRARCRSNLLHGERGDAGHRPGYAFDRLQVILETKKFGDMAQEYGVPMALHCAHTPIGALACVHAAAATENFLVLENHAVEVPFWSDLVNGIDKPIVNKGYITVPDKPGLGIALNEAACKEHLAEPGWFEPTDQWNNIGRPNDRVWS